MNKYDLIVIGGGAGGLYVAAGAANFGVKVALIEREAKLGGDCLHFGCVPSKALLAAAKKVHEARQAAVAFSMQLDGIPNLAAANARVQDAVAHIQKADSHKRFESLGIHLYEGNGRFVDQHHVRIGDDEVIYGKRIIIATGSRPAIPPIPGLDRVPFLTNETVFSLKDTPKSLITIGAGPIGLELSQALSRFGAKVTVLEGDATFLAKEDRDIADRAFTLLSKELEIKLGAKVQKVEQSKGMIEVHVQEENGQTAVISAEALLISAGRKPNIEHLSLEAAAIKYDKSIHVNDRLQTSQSHIYAIGDVNGRYPFTHGASLEGKTVVSNAVFGMRSKVKYHHFPWVTYTDPEIFHLGMTEQEARKKYGDHIQVYTLETGEVDRFVAERDMEGIVKVITNAKGYIIGAHAVGANASDWMQEVIYAKHFGKKFSSFSQVIHPYPSKGEAVKRVADLYWRERLFSGSVPKILKTFVRIFR